MSACEEHTSVSHSLLDGGLPRVVSPLKPTFAAEGQNATGRHLLDQGIHSTSDPPHYVSACEEHPSESHSLLEGGLPRVVSPLKPACC